MSWGGSPEANGWKEHDVGSGENWDAPEWKRSRKTLLVALAENRKLRAKILGELEKIAMRKKENRTEAIDCLEGMPIFREEASWRSCQYAKESSTPPEQMENETSGKRGKKRKKDTRTNVECIPSNADIHRLLANDKNCKETLQGKKESFVCAPYASKEDDEITSQHDNDWSLYQRKKFQYDPYRNWTLDYFVDPTGSHPKENNDTLRRWDRMMKTEVGSQEIIRDNFFYHRSQPFTPQETSLLNRWFSEDDAINHPANNVDDIADSFYDRIAKKLRESHHEDPKARKKDKVLLQTCAPRLPEEIELYKRSKLANQYRFTKEESLAILEGIRERSNPATDNTEDEPNEHNDGENNDITASDVQNRPDWRKIHERVRKLNMETSQKRKHQSNDRLRNEISDIPITPYQCMVHYKRNLRRRPDGSFTPEEDELLLRYITAMGPQFIWGNLEIADLSSRLFSTKPPRRVYERTHFSHWHPLSKDAIWTKEEEQKLVLAMKIYAAIGRDTDPHSNSQLNCSSEDEDSDDGTGNEPSTERRRIKLEKAALRKAALHFHPQRQLYKVAKKWDRSFSPRFSHRPFSKEEDSRLLEAVKVSASTAPFSEIAKKYFSNRSGDQLNQRWTKIASETDVAEKLVPFMIRSGVKRGLVEKDDGNGNENRSTSKTERNAFRNTSQCESSKLLFEPNDFIVEAFPTDR